MGASCAGSGASSDASARTSPIDLGPILDSSCTYFSIGLSYTECSSVNKRFWSAKYRARVVFAYGHVAAKTGFV
jgi:hypothetical protein